MIIELITQWIYAMLKQADMSKLFSIVKQLPLISAGNKTMPEPLIDLNILPPCTGLRCLTFVR